MQYTNNVAYLKNKLPNTKKEKITTIYFAKKAIKIAFVSFNLQVSAVERVLYDKLVEFSSTILL